MNLLPVEDDVMLAEAVCDGIRQHAWHIHHVADAMTAMPGVPKEEQVAIFDRFHRVAGSGTRGRGIGLSLVARIARLHDAQIETCDGIGAPGFCVRIVFPTSVPAI